MRHVPKYLVPRINSVPSASSITTTPSANPSDSMTADLAGKVDTTTRDVGFVPFKKDNGRGNKSGRGSRGRGRGGHGGSGGGRKKDPLRKF